MTRSSSSLRDFIYAALFAALIIVLGFVSIPIGPVPISGINFGVMIGASILAPKQAVYSVLIVILLGAAGLPVFSGFVGGIGVLMGPRGGYYIGFILEAYFTAKFIGSDNSTMRLFWANLIGDIVLVYIIAVPWLIFVTQLNLRQAFFIGMLPFMPGDLIKIILTTLFVKTLHKNIPSLVKRHD